MVGTSLRKVCKKKDRVQPDAKKEFVDIFLTDDITSREERFLAINSNHHVGDDSLLQAWVEIQERRPVKRMALAKQTIAGAFYHPPQQGPALPILMVGSEKDKIVKPECICAVQKHLNADLAMHASSGHGVPIDAPIWLADQVSSWTLSGMAQHTPPLEEATLIASEAPNWEERQIEWVQQNLWEIGRVTEKTFDAALFWEKD